MKKLYRTKREGVNNWVPQWKDAQGYGPWEYYTWPDGPNKGARVKFNTREGADLYIYGKQKEDQA